MFRLGKDRTINLRFGRRNVKRISEQIVALRFFSAKIERPML